MAKTDETKTSDALRQEILGRFRDELVVDDVTRDHADALAGQLAELLDVCEVYVPGRGESLLPTCVLTDQFMLYRASSKVGCAPSVTRHASYMAFHATGDYIIRLDGSDEAKAILAEIRDGIRAGSPDAEMALRWQGRAGITA